MLESKFRWSKQIAGSILLGIWLQSGTAISQINTLTFSGIVSSGVNKSLFGQDLNLSGKHFVESFTFDSARASTFYNGNFYSISADGISVSPFMKAELTIGGFTYTDYANTANIMASRDVLTFNGVDLTHHGPAISAGLYNNNNWIQMDVTSISPNSPANFPIDITAPFNTTLAQAGMIGSAQFQVSSNGFYQTSPVPNQYAYGVLSAQTITSFVGTPISVSSAGGAKDSPAKINVAGPISNIKDIVDVGTTEKFYRIHWNGGSGFGATVSVDFSDSIASNESSYQIELFDSTGAMVPLLHYQADGVGRANFDNLLNSANNFTKTFTAAGDGIGGEAGGYYDYCNLALPPARGCGLHAGDYTIGIIGVTSIDPTLTINFDMPVFATANAPEPAIWATMIVGFGLIGGTKRRRRWVDTQARTEAHRVEA